MAVADTPEERTQGLMFVNDLGELDGMLFIFESMTSTSFWMENVPIPLDIAFFDIAGRHVETLSMVPCTPNPCGFYTPSGPYAFAIEARTGAFDDIDDLRLGSVTQITE